MKSVGFLLPVRPSDELSAESAVRQWALSDCERQVRRCLLLLVDTADRGSCLSYNDATCIYLAFVSFTARCVRCSLKLACGVVGLHD